MANSGGDEVQQRLQDLQSLLFPLDRPSVRRTATDYDSGGPVFRGPLYEAYSVLRESKLRQKTAALASAASKSPNPKKKVSFLDAAPARHESSLLALSVPDFSAVLRKENRKPNVVADVTPPAGGSKGAWRGGGLSRSASGGEKRGGGAVRKSCLNLKELKGLSAAAVSAIDEAGRGGRSKGGSIKMGSRVY